MENTYAQIVAAELHIQKKQVADTLALLDGGATVPFIARYRKEATGSLDEVAIAAIRDRVNQLRELDKRRESIIKSIEEQGKMTPELRAAIDAAESMAVLEDVYLPYKPKRKTRASMARDKGLEPLALWLLEQRSGDPSAEAAAYVAPERSVANTEEALQGARDIIAEIINEDAAVRAAIRSLFQKKAVITSRVLKGKEQEGQKYSDYFDWQEPLKDVPSHRLLAMRRGEKEMILSLDIAPAQEDAMAILEKQYVKADNACGSHVRTAAEDGYKRLLKPGIETEVRLESKKKADAEAIAVFRENLRQLLLAAPLGQKNVMAIDPGFRTGCKVACLDGQGQLLHHDAIYPHEPQRRIAEAAGLIKSLVSKYAIQAIAIGNGTAGRETEQFVKAIGLPKEVMVVMVNESGASIYSASDIAREEFPDKDVTVRGSVSIGRRLMDPLAELVKIDPKSIGVGQYQHDVDQAALRQSLDDTVMSCVNGVGVEVNTASKELLSYVSGVGATLAKNIVDFRNANGPFTSREALKEVPRLGDKIFEQAAGFLRIGNAANPLDRSAVHPERYSLVQQMATDQHAAVSDLMTKPELRKGVNLKKYVSGTVGLPTLEDILKELEKPGRDPREQFEVVEFMEGVNHMEDLKVGMTLNGVVTNVTNFGAFVDIGVHQDGLVHKSHLADKYVENPADYLKVQQKVQVTVMAVDASRKRISLSMRSNPFDEKPKKQFKKKEEKPDSFHDKLSQLQSKFKR
jgi:uncharacterized protein